MPALSSHEGGGAWPGGVCGPPPGPPGSASLFGTGRYSGNIVQGGSVLQPVNGVVTVTGAATVPVDPETLACVVTAHSLVLDGAGASLSAADKSRGLYLHLTGDLRVLNGACLNMDGKGRGGVVAGDSSEADVLPDSLRLGLALGRLAAIRMKQPGASGGAGGPPSGPSYNQGTPGGTGCAAGPLQTGGGGGGGSGNYDINLGAGDGGPGTAFCGGAGGGGATRHSSGGTAGGDATAACAGGGGGGNSAGNGGGGGGGAGDPVGAGGLDNGGTYGSPGAGSGGGVLLAFVRGAVAIGPGSRVSADGCAGGAARPSTGGGGGGGAGGGLVCLFHRGPCSNQGTVRANGGLGGARGGPETCNCPGGPGGAGSVLTQAI